MTHKLGNNGFIGVEVPEGAYGFMVNNYADSSELMYMLDVEDIDETIKTDETLITKQLPPGTHTFCFLYPDGVTEENAAEIVEKIVYNNEPIYYKIYTEERDSDGDQILATTDSVRSIRTLFQSLNIHDKIIAVCQKKSQ